MIFDFNGVILWDGAWHDQAWKEVSLETRGKALTAEETKNIVRGRTNEDIFTYLLGRPLTIKEKRELPKLKEEKYQRIALTQPNFTLSPGAESLFNLLKEKEIPFTIATASDTHNVTFYFQHLPLPRWFSIESIVYDDGSLPGKPAPDVYLRAAEKLNLDPAVCIVVEDSKSGILAAQRAGIGKIIALAHDSSRGMLKSLPNVHRIITSLAEVTLKDFEN